MTLFKKSQSEWLLNTRMDLLIFWECSFHIPLQGKAHEISFSEVYIIVKQSNPNMIDLIYLCLVSVLQKGTVKMEVVYQKIRKKNTGSLESLNIWPKCFLACFWISWCKWQVINNQRSRVPCTRRRWPLCSLNICSRVLRGRPPETRKNRAYCGC